MPKEHDEPNKTIKNLWLINALGLEPGYPTQEVEGIVRTHTGEDTGAQAFSSPRSPACKREAEDTPVTHADIRSLKQELKELNEQLMNTNYMAKAAVNKANTLKAAKRCPEDRGL